MRFSTEEQVASIFRVEEYAKRETRMKRVAIRARVWSCGICGGQKSSSKESSATCWSLARVILRFCRWRRHVPPKRRLTFNGLHGFTSQKTQFYSADSSIVKMKALNSFKATVNIYQAKRRHLSEESNLHSHCRENLKCNVRGRVSK
jgi:hypothetical protein